MLEKNRTNDVFPPVLQCTSWTFPGLCQNYVVGV